MDKLNKEIDKYCEINNLEVNEYKNKILRLGFNVDKYGNKPEFMMSDSSSKLLEKCEEKFNNLNVKYEKLLTIENKLEISDKDNEKDIYGE